VTQPAFQGHGVIRDAIGVLHAQLTRDLFAIAKFLLIFRLRHVAQFDRPSSKVSM